jgi:hypothetical protein
MKIISYNVNGIRAAIKKGLIEWLKVEMPDIFCIQETKANQEQVDTTAFEEMGYHINWFGAQKKGYSGVAIFSLQKPNKIIKGIGIEKYDNEGRTIRADFGEFTIINSYTTHIPGHVHLDRLGYSLKDQLEQMGFNVWYANIGAAICDGIAMGHFGMKYSLASRELITDQIESIIGAHPCDGWVGIGNCDKIELVELLVEFLQSANEGDDWGYIVKHWPKVDSYV